MATNSVLYRRVIECFSALVDAVEPEDWSRPTPCEGWTVQDLIRHVVDRDHRIQASLGGPPFIALAPDGDLAASWHHCVGWWAENLADPAVRDGEWTTVLGSMTFADAADRMMIGELTLHGWDLARALSLDETMDPEAVRVGFAGLREALATLKAPLPDGPTVADDAPDDVVFLAFSGRRA